MMKAESEYYSCVVRLWREEQAGDERESPAWMGDILHIQSGEKWPIHGLEEVLDILENIKIESGRFSGDGFAGVDSQ